MSTTIIGSGSRVSPGARRLARGLGLFSLALGAAKVAAPGRLARALGMKKRAGAIRATGVRELVSGIGTLAARRPTAWIWSRVLGGIVEAGTLLYGLKRNRRRRNVGIALGAMAGVAALDLLCGRQLGRAAR